MGIVRKLKDYIMGEDEDYDLDSLDRYHYFDDEIVGEVMTIKNGEAVPDFKYDKERITEEERKNCLKLYQLACGFNELDAATVLCVLCQTYPEIVVSAVANEWSELRDTLKKYERIKKL